MRLQKNILKDKDTFVFELTNLLKKEINYDEKILGKWTELNLPVSLDLNKDERVFSFHTEQTKETFTKSPLDSMLIRAIAMTAMELKRDHRISCSFIDQVVDTENISCEMVVGFIVEMAKQKFLSMMFNIFTEENLSLEKIEKPNLKEFGCKKLHFNVLYSVLFLFLNKLTEEISELECKSQDNALKIFIKTKIKKHRKKVSQ